MTAMQGQQESEVGVIPEGWSVATLGDLGRCIRGVSYKPENLMQETGEGVTTLLRSNNIKNDRVNFDDVQFVTGCKISEDQLVRPFDIAICMSNGSKALVGKSGVVTPAHLAGHPKLTVGAFCAIYRSPVQYTAQIFKSQFFQSAIDVQLAGSAINNLKGSDIEGIRFPLPPLEEQQKIAAILTAVDNKLGVIARQIEATQTLKQGLMQALFSRGVGTQDADGRWVPHAAFKDSELGRIPQTWRVCQLQDISEFITKGGTPTTYGFDWVRPEDGIPFFRSECVTDQGFNSKGMNFIAHEAHRQMERSEVQPGDVLMTITGNIGRVARAPVEYATANINQHIARVRINDGDAEYVYQCLKQDFYAKHYGAILTGQAYPQISLKQVRETPVVLAPLLEQKHIARVLADADVKTALLGRKLAAFQTLKRGLMQKLLTGEWRVTVGTSAAGA